MYVMNRRICNLQPYRRDKAKEPLGADYVIFAS